MIFVKNILLILFLLAVVFHGFAQKAVAVDDVEIRGFELLSADEKVNTLISYTDSLISSEPEVALVYARRALDLSGQEKNDTGRLLAMNRIAELYWKKTDLTKALSFAERAKKLALQLENKREYGESLLIIGKVYTDLGDYDKSTELNFEAYRIFEKENDTIGIGNALNRIGYDYFEQEYFDKALEYYSQSLDFARSSNDLKGISRGLNNVAAVYGTKGDYVHAQKFITEAVEINKKLDLKLLVGVNYMNLGQINLDTRNFEQAYFYFHMADSIFTKLNNVPKLSAIYISLSNYYSVIGSKEKSLEYAHLAFEIAQSNKLKRSIYAAAWHLHNLYLEQDSLAKAYQYLSIQYQMKDSLDVENSLTRMSQLELMHEFEKLNQEQKLLQQRRDYLWIIVGTVLFSLLSFVIILLVARQRIRAKNEAFIKKQLENDIDTKNKELTSNVMALMRKNEVLSDIAGKLMDVRDEAVKDETKSAIKKIARELQNSTDDEVWKEFEIRFRQVHSAFYDALILQFPNLSPAEQRLCAFLRLNMTTKEISELTGQRTSSLEIARSRLRKKLGIANTQINLVNFLSQI